MDSVKDIIIIIQHEHQDGSGYPNGLMSNDIPIEVSIVSVADCLEAISGARPYRRAYTFEDAIEIMNKESCHFHTDVLSAANSLVESGTLTGKEFGLH